MAVLAAQSIARTGITPTFAAATVSGDTFVNDERMFIRVKNAAGAPITVTVTPARTVDGLTPAGRQVTIEATTGDKSIGPFSNSDYGVDSVVSVTYSAVTSVTVGLFRLPPV
jgi:hypothetical protein